MKRAGFKQKTYEQKLASKNYRKGKKRKQVKRWNVKLWSVKKTDIEFSKWIRRKGKCEKCRATEGLTNSHYIGRKEYATRFDPENCHCLCWTCHALFEPRKQYEYKDWVIATYGKEMEERLRLKKQSYKSSQQSIYDCMVLLGAIKL